MSLSLLVSFFPPFAFRLLFRLPVPESNRQTSGEGGSYARKQNSHAAPSSLCHCRLSPSNPGQPRTCDGSVAVASSCIVASVDMRHKPSASRVKISSPCLSLIWIVLISRSSLFVLRCPCFVLSLSLNKSNARGNGCQPFLSFILYPVVFITFLVALF